jgi:tetratricopeptide (TPR) repeat protein
VGRALLALAAVALVVAALPLLRAEWVYGAARGFGTRPSEDLPGRLEAYAEAARLDPREGAYRFRRGQILLDRARRDAAFLPEAESDLKAAAALRPIDPRVRSELAEVLLRRGDLQGARRESDIALRLGPRHRAVLARAVELRLRLWRVRRESEDLRAALSSVRTSDAIGDAQPARALARFVARSGPFVAADLLEATDGDPALRAFAARALAADYPDLARVLAEPAGKPR